MTASPSSAERAWPWRAVAALLILASGALHVRYVASNCPLDLAPDEAHYWHWAQHLDASYYSKGPLVAWLIRGSCELFGDTVFAVRLPAVLCGTLLLVSLYILTVQALGRDKLAALVVGVGLTVPALSVGRTFMTIDSPYACCWGWALVLGHCALIRGANWAWLPLGLVVGVGILAKYTMALWLPSAGLFLLLSRDHRPLLRRPGFWLAASTAGLCCLPIVWWNIRNDWVTLRHVAGQAGVVEAASKPLIRWTGPLEFLAGQFGLLLGVWFALWLIAMVIHRPTCDSDPNRRYLWFMSAPMFAVFGLFSLRTE
ncbi:MAG: glycosyltransferase family 39 protein, partial [Gemmataceae bacterium]